MAKNGLAKIGLAKVGLTRNVNSNDAESDVRVANHGRRKAHRSLTTGSRLQ